MSIKFKQEVGKPGTKDKVLGKAVFDVARFAGKDNVIYEMNLESNETTVGARVTLEISVVKLSDKAIIGGSGDGAALDQDLIFNDSSDEEDTSLVPSHPYNPE